MLAPGAGKLLLPAASWSVRTQAARIGVVRADLQRIPRTLEVPVRGAGVPSAPGENGGVNGILDGHDQMVPLQQSYRPFFFAGLYQCLDQSIRDVRHSALGSLRRKRIQDVFRPPRFSAFRVAPDHLRCEERRSLMGLPRGLNAPKRLAGFPESPQMGGVPQRRQRGVFRVCRQRGLKEGPLLVELETRWR